MKILILGGTGAIGTHLVNVLESKGHEILVTSRKPQSSHGLTKFIHGDAHDLDFLNEILLEKWDALVDFMVYATSEFQGRMNLLLDSTSQYVFISSARVYSESNDAIKEDFPRLLNITKDEDFLSSDEYSLAKARQEDLLVHSNRKNWTIIRPYISYSIRRLQLGVLEKEEWLYRALKGRTIVFPKEMLNKKTTFTYGLDVSIGIASIIGAKGAFGNVFNITNQFCYTWKQIFEVYAEIFQRVIGHSPKISLVEMKKFYSCHPAKFQIIYDRMYNRRFNNERINEFISTREFVPTNIGLSQCLFAFIGNPCFNHINWVSEAKMDKITGEIAPLSEILGLKNKLKYLLFRFVFTSQK